MCRRHIPSLPALFSASQCDARRNAAPLLRKNADRVRAHPFLPAGAYQYLGGLSIVLARLVSCVALAAAVLLTGCATPTPMAYGDDTRRTDAPAKPVMLMTASFKNKYRPDYQPKLIVLHVERVGATEAKDRINFTIDDKAKMETGKAESGNTYLLRMELPPGKYQIMGMTSRAGIFPVTGMYFAPLHLPLDVKGDGVF